MKRLSTRLLNMRNQSTRHPSTKLLSMKPPSMKNPSMKLPSMRLPNMKPPSMKNPSMKLPSTKLLSMKPPSMRNLSMKLPSTRLPNTKPPSMKNPSMKLLNTKNPSMRLPNMKLLNTRNPSMRLPNMKSPSMKHPNTNRPSTKLPSTKSPSMKRRNMKRPSMRSPNMKSPNTRLPSICHLPPPMKNPSTKRQRPHTKLLSSMSHRSVTRWRLRPTTRRKPNRSNTKRRPRTLRRRRTGRASLRRRPPTRRRPRPTRWRRRKRRPVTSITPKMVTTTMSNNPALTTRSCLKRMNNPKMLTRPTRPPTTCRRLKRIRATPRLRTPSLAKRSTSLSSSAATRWLLSSWLGLGLDSQFSITLNPFFKRRLTKEVSGIEGFYNDVNKNGKFLLTRYYDCGARFWDINGMEHSVILHHLMNIWHNMLLSFVLVKAPSRVSL